MTGLVTGRIVYFVFDDASAAEVTRRRTTGASIAQRMAVEVLQRVDPLDVRFDHPIEVHGWPAGAQAHIGNPVRAGDVCPAMVVATAPDSHQVNLQVFLDGCDVYWARGVAYEEWSGDAEALPTPGTWHWMFTGQASRYTPLPPA